MYKKTSHVYRNFTYSRKIKIAEVINATSAINYIIILHKIKLHFILSKSAKYIIKICQIYHQNLPGFMKNQSALFYFGWICACSSCRDFTWLPPCSFMVLIPLMVALAAAMVVMYGIFFLIAFLRR